MGFGNAVTVVEMDGEIDMDNMEAQLKEIEDNLEGLAGKSSTELTEAMTKLKSSPGSQNGTGLLQTVIAMKVREVYEKMTSKVESVPTGLVWPSPEAEAKLREEDGIKLYPTHAWTDDMKPIVPASKTLEQTPVIIGVAADSGCGKSTFL